MSTSTGKIIGLAGGALAAIVGGGLVILLVVVSIVSGAAQQGAGGLAASLLTQKTSAGDPSCAPGGTVPVPGGEGEGSVDAEQLANVKTIVGVAKSAWSTPALQRQAALVALMTAWQESTMRNIDYGDRDSLGLFQQRPSMGWGTAEQIRTPAYAAGRFYKALAATPGWESDPPGKAAQRVQRSAFPDHYDKWQGRSEALLVLHFDAAPAVAIPAAVGFGGQGGSDGGVVDVGCSIGGGGELINPMIIGSYTISSVFGGRPAPCASCSSDHKGVDYSASCGTPVYAATSGTITIAGKAGGYGNVIFLTGSSLVTVYGHLQASKPFNVKMGDVVKSGDLIGWVGTTGNSTGCHLHFETRIDSVQVDPMTQFELAGVKW